MAISMAIFAAIFMATFIAISVLTLVLARINLRDLANFAYFDRALENDCKRKGSWIRAASTPMQALRIEPSVVVLPVNAPETSVSNACISVYKDLKLCSEIDQFK